MIVAIVAIVLAGAALVWAVLSPPRRPIAIATPTSPAAPETPMARSPSPASSEPGASSGLTPLATPSRDPAAVAFGKPTPRSPLERSPGYYPPDDPESMSVVTGRREAPAVDLELAGGAESMDALARKLVAGLNARDERALHALRVTREEFEVILWREFPESRPVTHITADDAWEMSNTQSVAGASSSVGLHESGHLEFIRVGSSPSTPYRNFTLHRGVEIIARDTATSREVRIQFAPSLVERHGRYKVLTFKD